MSDNACYRQLTCFCPPVAPIIRLVVSNSASKTEQTGKLKAKKFVLLIVAVTVSVLGYFAFRTMRGLMMLGFVDSAIGRVRAISAAETQFAKEHPELGYTCALSQLPRSEEMTRLLAKNRIDNGYAFEIIKCQVAVPKKPNSTYSVTARPLHTGQPAFCSDQSGILMSDEAGSVERCLAKRTAFP
jgi:hypothetical protein